MKAAEKNNRRNKFTNKCRDLRIRLSDMLNSHSSIRRMCEEHIANCPRCRRRFISCGKVNMALSFIKSQPLKTDLLMRANTQAINVLQHSLREAPKAQKLREIRPDHKPLEKFSRYIRPSGSAAACILVLILMKIGIFVSIEKIHEQGQKAIEQYYTWQVGESITSEIFTDSSKEIS